MEDSAGTKGGEETDPDCQLDSADSHTLKSLSQLNVPAVSADDGFQDHTADEVPEDVSELNEEFGSKFQNFTD